MIKLRSLPSALALLALSLLLNLAWADCYLPNGTSITQLRGSPQWLPCNSSSPYSMCCRTNGTGTSDTCLPNGLCHNDVAPNLWRESCTDPTWQSPYCLQLCTSATAINTGNPNWPDGTPLRDSHVPLTQCQDGSYCCGNDNTNCCAAGQGVFVVNENNGTYDVQSSSPAASSSTTSSSSTSSASSTSSTSSSSSSSSNTPAPSSSSSSDAGAIAGGVVGGVAGLALIALALWWVLRRPQKNKQPTVAPTELDTHEQQVSELPNQPAGASYYRRGNENDKKYWAGTNSANPMSERSGMTEIPGTHELPSGRP